MKNFLAMLFIVAFFLIMGFVVSAGTYCETIKSRVWDRYNAAADIALMEPDKYKVIPLLTKAEEFLDADIAESRSCSYRSFWRESIRKWR